jgi:hypothetical protein
VLISYTREFIFFHVYRVAGSSIRRALEESLGSEVQRAPRPLQEDRWLDRVQRRLRRGSRSGMVEGDRRFGPPSYPYQHIPARELRSRMDAETFDRFFKFGFVRNPWDWQVSQYFFIRQRESHPEHQLVMGMSDFKAYLEWKVDGFSRNDLQKTLLTDAGGELLVDFVGKFESLDQDFDRVCERLGLSVDLPRRNASNHRDYREYYDAGSAELVGRVFRDDIQMFGYEFGGE